MFFILKNETIRQNAALFVKGLEANGYYCVEIKEYKPNRSLAQNRLLWSWYNVIKKETGNDPEDLHEEMKVRILGVEEKERAGVKLIVPKGSRWLSTKEFTMFLEAVEMLANQLGIILPYPTDYDFIMTGRK